MHKVVYDAASGCCTYDRYGALTAHLNNALYVLKCWCHTNLFISFLENVK